MSTMTSQVIFLVIFWDNISDFLRKGVIFCAIFYWQHFVIFWEGVIFWVIFWGDFLLATLLDVTKHS